jgi:hypothetical protein
MIDLKVAYKKCVELYSGNMDHFKSLFSSKDPYFIMEAYQTFITRTTMDSYAIAEDIDEIYYELYYSRSISDKHKKEFIDAISSVMQDVFDDEYNYHNEYEPSLSSGKFFLNNPHLTAKRLFYKKMDKETYYVQFMNTPSYRKMDLLANYEEVV